LSTPVKKKDGTKYIFLLIFSAIIGYILFYFAFLIENNYLLYLGLFFAFVFLGDGLVFLTLSILGKID
jgi:hypothetical protein